jgi:hypothetical protein
MSGDPKAVPAPDPAPDAAPDATGAPDGASVRGPVEVRVVEDDAAQRYNALLGAEMAGFVTYRGRGERRVLVHTEVDPQFEGRGVGSRLVKGVLEDLRGRGIRAQVLCPFITDYLKRHPDYSDVVEPRG